jgi:hypothetical protein
LYSANSVVLRTLETEVALMISEQLGLDQR